MNRSYCWSLGLLVPLSLVVGCSHEDAQPPATSVAASHPAPAPVPQRAAAPAAVPAKAKDDSDEGVLTVSKDVVVACPNLRHVAEQARSVDPEGVWVAILAGVSECMNDGGLKGRHILVAGDVEHRDVVRLVLFAKGAPMDRVIVRAPSAAAPCGATPCEGSGHVEIVLLP